MKPEDVIVPSDAATVKMLTEELDKWWAGLTFAEKMAVNIDAFGPGGQR